MEKRYFNIKEISEYLSISTKTIYRWAAQRKIPATKIGKIIRFDIQAVDKWLKDFKREVVE